MAGSELDARLRGSIGTLIAQGPETTQEVCLLALRQAAGQGFSQDGIVRALDCADHTNPHPGATWAAALVVLRVYAAPELQAGLGFWAACGVPVFTAAFRIIREALPQGYETLLKQVGFLSDRAGDAARRRAYFALHKAYPEQYWPNHGYIETIKSDHWRFALIRRLVASHPAHVANAAALVLAAARPADAPAALVARIIDDARHRLTTDPITHWSAIHVGDVLIRHGESALAMAVLRRACTPDVEKTLRFEMLRLMAMAQMQGPLEGLSQLRCLVTALRVYPGHVRAHELLRQTLALLRNVPDIRICYEPADFAAGKAELLIMDGQIDIAMVVQARLQLAEFMRELELAVVDPHAPASAANSEILIARASVELPDFAGGGELDEGLDPWMFATQPRNHRSQRRAVEKMTLQDVYFSHLSNAAIYLERAGKPIPALSSGHAGFFGRQFIAEQEAEMVPGESFDLTVPYGQLNYSHFLLDRAPRLIFAPPTGTLLVDAESMGWTQELLELLGVSRTLRAIHRDRLYFSERLTAMTCAQHPAQLGYPPFLAFLRRLAGSTAPAGRRIFVHRDRGSRGIHNEESFHLTLEAEGFEVVRLETMSLAAQIEMFAQAQCVAGLHGAGLANIVFCAPGTTVIEILPLLYSTPAYLIIAAQGGLRYLPYIEPGAANRALATRAQFSDTEINIERWRGFLKRCLG